MSQKKFPRSRPLLESAILAALTASTLLQAQPPNIRMNAPQRPFPEGKLGRAAMAVAADEEGRRLVAAWDNIQGTCGPPYGEACPPPSPQGLTGFGYSTDGGRTWTDAGAPMLADGAMTAGHPWLERGGADNQTFFLVSRARNPVDRAQIGLTLHRGRFQGDRFAWEDGRLLRPAKPGDVWRSPSVAAARDGSGKVYVALSNLREVCGVPGRSGGQIELLRSADSGATWEGPAVAGVDDTAVTLDPKDPPLRQMGLLPVRHQRRRRARRRGLRPLAVRPPRHRDQSAGARHGRGHPLRPLARRWPHVQRPARRGDRQRALGDAAGRLQQGQPQQLRAHRRGALRAAPRPGLRRLRQRRGPGARAGDRAEPGFLAGLPDPLRRSGRHLERAGPPGPARARRRGQALLADPDDRIERRGPRGLPREPREPGHPRPGRYRVQPPPALRGCPRRQGQLPRGPVLDALHGWRRHVRAAGAGELETSNWCQARYDPAGFLFSNFGDYLGIFASGNRVFTVWTDGRAGVPDAYFATLGQENR